MSAKIIDGKALAARIKHELAEKVKAEGIKCTLAVVIVGDDPASRVYVNGKKSDCAEIGIESRELALPKETTQDELLKLINDLNHDDSVDGILVQLPLPKHINEEVIINNISPLKDVDAFHPTNVGKIMIGNYNFLPCTPAGVLDLIDETGTDLTGKHCVVVGRSNIVGKPQAMLLLHKNATVTICHSKTTNLKEVCRQADVLVVAVGRAEMIDAEYIKPGAVVIDVGMNRLEDGRLVGDVDFASANEVAGYITPVPGGVGPMTRATLMRNVIKAKNLN
ncbi:MAG: bifunctional methylenetetrahydrofolate dehydrogenase/methenyltetrahydrofolate cyclohydrolase FolD [Clostridiales bacterium]|nr:bifunctional methylenetetrahydrofolate dehydrogenase/methenyltetrahydrofolate cyclohydrolase FolD [Clostridiales bacterium]